MSARLALKKPNLSKVILISFLLMLLGFGAIPGYIKGQWTWQKPLPVTSISRMIKTRQTGIEIPGWQTKKHQEMLIGNQKWLAQEIESNGQTAILMLRPQQDNLDQPQVQWIDLKGSLQWKTDKYDRVRFTVPATAANQPATTIEAQFLRGWNPQETYAVLQWYAWYSGGSPEISGWFWADRISQWQGHRVPWIAVSIQIPIEPLGDIKPVLPKLQSLGQSVQSALMAGPLAKNQK